MKNNTRLYDYIEVQIKSGAYTYTLSESQVEEFVNKQIQKKKDLKLMSLHRNGENGYIWDLPDQEEKQLRWQADKAIDDEIDAIKNLSSRYVDFADNTDGEKTVNDILTFYFLIQNELKEFQQSMNLIGGGIPKKTSRRKEAQDIFKAPQNITLFRNALRNAEKVSFEVESDGIGKIEVKSFKQSNYYKLPKAVMILANYYLLKIPQIKNAIYLELSSFTLTPDVSYFNEVVDTLNQVIDNCGFYSQTHGTISRNTLEQPFYERLRPLYHYLKNNDCFAPKKEKRSEVITEFIIELLSLIDYKAEKRNDAIIKKGAMSFTESLTDIFNRSPKKEIFVIKY